MNRVYHIRFEVVRNDDLSEMHPHRVSSYVLAECPYQARFFVRSRLLNTPWVNLDAPESWEIVDKDELDTSIHRLEDVLDAEELGLVVVNVEPLSEIRPLAISA